MAIFPLLLLMLFSGISASTCSIPGENLWRLISNIGPSVDITGSKVAILLSDVDEIISDVDLLFTNFTSITDFLTSQADDINKDLNAAQGFLISLIDHVNKNFLSVSDVFVSDVEKIDGDLISIGDATESELEVINNSILSMQDSISDTIENTISLIDLIASDFDLLENDVFSVSNKIVHTLDSAQDDLSSQLEHLEDCLIGTSLMQTDFASGTLAITVPGLYTFCEDITAVSASPALNIAAGNVVINLNGYTFTVGSAGILISGQNNVQIKNGTIVTSNGNAITVETSAANVEISSITIKNGSVIVDHSIGVTINRLMSVGLSNGIIFDIRNNSNGVIIRDSSVTGTTASGYGEPLVGFQIDNSFDVLLEQCIVYTALNEGFLVQNNAFGVLLRDCYASSCVTGFSCISLSTSAPIMERCVSVFSSLTGFAVDLNSVGGIFVECIAMKNNYGFDLAGASTLLKRCVASANTAVGIRIDATAINTQIFDSCAKANATDIIDNGNATTFINLETVKDILLSELEEIQSCVCSGVDHAASVLDTLGTTIVSDLDFFVSATELLETCLVGTPITNADLPLTITNPGVYMVCGELAYNGSPAITINSNNVVLNCNHHTLTTNNNGIVCHGYTNIKIVNGTIIPTAGHEAIIIDSTSQGIILSNLTIYQPADVAIAIDTSFGVVIDNCIVQGYNGNSTGRSFPAALYFTSSGAVVANDCIVSGINSGTPVRGISVVESGTGGVELQRCTVRSTTNEAFRISSASATLDNVLVKNCVASNAGDGFLVIHTSGSSFGPVVESCIAESGTNGFVIQNTSGTMLSNCSATHNSSSGFLLGSTIDQTVALSCISQENNIGFEIDGTRTTLRWCTATTNATIGFNIDGNALNTVIQDCLASKNGSSGVVDNASTSLTQWTKIVDTRSQDPATATPNPAYNLNGTADSKTNALVILRS